MSARIPSVLRCTVLVSSVGLLCGCHTADARQQATLPTATQSVADVVSAAVEPDEPISADFADVQLASGEVDAVEVSLPNPAASAKQEHRAPSFLPESAEAGLPNSRNLSLVETLEIGLRRNPDLNTLREQANVSRAAVGVAETYPFNPVVQTRVLPYGRFKGGGDASVYNYVLFWQTFELAHQQQYREDNAQAALNGVSWNITQAEVVNLSVTEQLYFTALYQRGLYDLAEANAKLNADLLDVLQKQFEAGQASGADVAMVRLDARATEQQRRLSEANYQTALDALRRQLNLPTDVPLKLVGSITDLEWLPATEAGWLGNEGSDASTVGPQSLAQKLASARPDVMAARHAVSAARANVSLAEAAKVPNMMLGPFYVRDASGTFNLGFQAQMDVPIVNTGQPLVEQRSAEFHQQYTTLQQLESRAVTEAETALVRYERSRQLTLESSRDLQESIPEGLQHLEEQYRKGEVDVLRVIQARTSLLQLRRAHLDSLNEVAQAAAAVTAATGLPPHKLVRE